MAKNHLTGRFSTLILVLAIATTRLALGDDSQHRDFVSAGDDSDAPGNSSGTSGGVIRNPARGIVAPKTNAPTRPTPTRSFRSTGQQGAYRAPAAAGGRGVGSNKKITVVIPKPDPRATINGVISDLQVKSGAVTVVSGISALGSGPISGILPAAISAASSAVTTSQNNPYQAKIKAINTAVEALSTKPTSQSALNLNTLFSSIPTSESLTFDGRTVIDAVKALQAAAPGKDATERAKSANTMVTEATNGNEHVAQFAKTYLESTGHTKSYATLAAEANRPPDKKNQDAISQAITAAYADRQTEMRSTLGALGVQSLSATALTSMESSDPARRNHDLAGYYGMNSANGRAAIDASLNQKEKNGSLNASEAEMLRFLRSPEGKEAIAKNDKRGVEWNKRLYENISLTSDGKTQKKSGASDELLKGITGASGTDYIAGRMKENDTRGQRLLAAYGATGSDKKEYLAFERIKKDKDGKSVMEADGKTPQMERRAVELTGDRKKDEENFKAARANGMNLVTPTTPNKGSGSSPNEAFAKTIKLHEEKIAEADKAVKEADEKAAELEGKREDDNQLKDARSQLHTDASLARTEFFRLGSKRTELDFIQNEPEK